MTPPISRREFLKLAAALPAGLLWNRFNRPLRLASPGSPNVLVIVFDTWSANHLSLFGYRRQTSPELEAIANRAIVYHNHYAGANWTVPGTASLLTGLYPWTHRIFDTLGIQDLPNLFSLFQQGGYNLQSYTHNFYADRLIRPLVVSGQRHIDPESFYLASEPLYHRVFERDIETFKIARHQIFINGSNVTNSLFLPGVVRALRDWYYQRRLTPVSDQFQGEPPSIDESSNYYLLEEVLNWLAMTLPFSPQPFCHYYHFFPPHAPYRPRIEFSDLFDDDWGPEEKDFPFPGVEPQRKLNRLRRHYDQFVRNVDAEFTTLYRSLTASGVLDNTWLVLTSDHGELFERGVMGHDYITLHEPVVHVPLLIFPPGQSGRVDVDERTSAVDVLPTLLHLTGLSIPPSMEGSVLPPFNEVSPGSDRQIFAINARDDGPGTRMSEATIALLQGDYKLSYYYGHPEMEDVPEYYELYDLANDPEELENLYPMNLPIAQQLNKTLQDRLAAAESPYKAED